MNRSKILIVDDESLVRKMICRVLGSEGMQTFEAANGADAVQMASRESFDLIILDIVMSGMDGFQVLHTLREREIYTPVFVLSGRREDNDKVFALGIGADDYVTKPFSTSVLCAKVKACLRRVHLSGAGPGKEIVAGPFRYLAEEMRLLKDGEEISLSSKESFLIKYMMSNAGKVLTREQIYQNVWGDTVVDDNTIMVHIRRLRTKIEEEPNRPLHLRTIRGVGYQFVV